MDKFKELAVDEQVELIQKYQSVSDKDAELLHKYYDVAKHDVMSRPDREQKEVTIKNAERVYKTLPPHEVNKISIPFVNDIIDSSVSFACGNPLDVSFDGGTDEQIKAIEGAMHDNKTMSLNRKMCRALFGFREVAEIWYVDEEDTKLRVHLVSPMFGDKLYPIFDSKRRMQAFAYSNSRTEGEEEITELVLHTNDNTIIYHKVGDSSDWQIVDVKENVFGKITVAYGNQGEADYEKVIASINRLEKTHSNLADSVDDVAYPDKVFKGTIGGVFHRPGEGSRYEIDGDGDIKVVESSQATGLIELDLNSNRNIVNAMTRTADLSLENLKGLGAGLSGETLRRMLTGSILKVQSKREYLDDYYQRRYNIVNTMLSYLKGWDAKSLTISIKIIPYVPEDIDANIDQINKMALVMPRRYLVGRMKERVDPSIDVDEIMKWIKEEKEFEYGGSLMEEDYE